MHATDVDGLRLTCITPTLTNVPIAALELRHRQRARAEGRIRAVRATGLTNLSLHDCAEPDLAGDRPARPDRQAKVVVARRLRLRLFPAAAQIATTARRRYLKFARHWPWTGAIRRLDALPNSG